MTEDDKTVDATLAPFFDAARAEAISPSTALLNRILADAAAERDVRHVAAAPQPPGPRSRWRRLLAAIDPVGGWQGVAALGAFAAIGFVAGMSGLDVAGDYLWSQSPAEAAAGVEAFFDLAAVEG